MDLLNAFILKFAETHYFAEQYLNGFHAAKGFLFSPFSYFFNGFSEGTGSSEGA